MTDYYKSQYERVLKSYESLTMRLKAKNLGAACSSCLVFCLNENLVNGLCPLCKKLEDDKIVKCSKCDKLVPEEGTKFDDNWGDVCQECFNEIEKEKQRHEYEENPEK